MNAPQKVVAELFGRRALEGGDADVHRIDTRENLANDAVFAGGVHALQHDQEGSLAFGIQPVTQLVDDGDVFFGVDAACSFSRPS